MIQTYSLGTSITRIDGANIATGTINAQDAILQGSLTADRINATSIQASTLLIPAIVNGINGGVGGTWIDGGSIRTGTVDTNRLNVTGVIQAINSEGSTTINGGKITTGTLTVGHLTADTLSAGKIKASLLDVDGMISVINGGSLTKITGAGIATGAIDATKLTLRPGGMGTINVDPMLQDSSLWISEIGSHTFQTVTDAPVGTRIIRSAPNATTYLCDTTYYPIDPAKRYRVRFYARRSSDANGKLYFCLRQYINNTGTSCATNGGRSPYKPSAVTPDTSWTEYSFEWGPSEWQSGVKFVKLDWLLHYSATAGYVEMCYPRFEEMVNAELIVDGAVTANSIRTGEFYSQGSGGSYASYNSSTGIATGFKLAHTPFTATNKWGRSQSIQAEFGNTVLVKGYPLGPALGIPLSALDFPPLDQVGAQSRVFYRGNNDPGGVPNIDCLDIKDLGVSMYDHNYFSAVMQWRLQPTKPSDNLDGMRMMRIKVYPHAGGSIAYDTVYVPMCDRLYATVPLNVTASGSGSVLTVTAMPAGNITASCYGTTLTVTAVSGVSLAVGMYIVGAGFSSDTQIAALGTGTGGAGTYMVTTSQTVGSGSFLATLTPIAVGMGVVGPNIPANTTIVSLGTGTGGTGTYNLSQDVSSSFSATSITITTDNSPFNAAWGQASFGHRMSSGGSGVLYYGDSPYPFYGHLLVSISNAYGWSAERWFHPISTTAVDLWFTRNTTPPAGAPPSGGGTGGTGGGGGCTPAGTPFLTPGGVIPVEQLKAGDFAVAYDEHTLVPHYSRVNRVYEYEARQLYRIITDRGELVCSHDHRLALVAGINLVEYPPARDLSYGDLLLHRKDDGSVENAMVLSVHPLDRYEKVYHCTLDSGHVYVAGDFLAHNISKFDIFSRD